jgi:hypothetical protein
LSGVAQAKAEASAKEEPLASAERSEAGQPFNVSEGITIFFTGNELGTMKPCGCSGGQLGGLDRRYAVFSTIPPENRLIIDTGSLVTESTEQNLIKFNVIVQAFGQLGYNVVNLTEQDIIIARQAGIFDGLSSVFNCITANCPDDANLPAKFTKRFVLGGLTVDVTVAVADTDEQIFETARSFPVTDHHSYVPFNILIVSRPDAAAVAADARAIDCVIVPPRSDEPMLVSDANSRPLVVSAGRLGKYVGKIQVDTRQPGKPSTQMVGRPRLSFSAVPITNDLYQHQQLVNLYKDYQRMVKEANLLEEYPRFVLPDNLEYVGSRFCKLCHGYEYEKWMTGQQVFIPGLPRQASADSRHADAFATLEKVGSNYDPECVICHAVGMRYYSGFASPTKTPELKDVGCENCHGPGSEHIRSLGAVETAGPISSCTDCHTQEQSAEYAGNEKQYFEKSIHWREPTSAVRVREH